MTFGIMTQHDDIEHKGYMCDTQHKEQCYAIMVSDIMLSLTNLIAVLNFITLSVVMLSIIMLSLAGPRFGPKILRHIHIKSL
jgi:hypothetical protein